MPKPTLYLMVGYPGAGKTTAAQIIAELTGAVHLWTDKERREKFGEIYRPEDSGELYSFLNARAVELLRGGQSVVFDTNFNYFKDRDHLQQLASQAGANTQIVWLTVPKETASRRALTRAGGKREYVNMSHADFERVASHLEPPTEAEQPVKIDGTDVTPETVRQALNL